jgi:CBS domain-containing protein
MLTDPVTVCSTTPTLEAIEIMRTKRIGCLPVVDDGQLVGIVTSYDFLEASASLIQRELNSLQISSPQITQITQIQKKAAAK